MTEEERAQESKQRGLAAAKIADPAKRRAYIAQQGGREASELYRAGQKRDRESVGRSISSFGGPGSPQRVLPAIVRSVVSKVGRGSRKRR
jgi:hypothetical protein